MTISSTMTPAERLRARRREVLASHDAVDTLLRRMRRLADEEADRLRVTNPALAERLFVAVRETERTQEADLATADELLAAEAAACEHEDEVRKWKLRHEFGVDGSAATPLPTPPLAWMPEPAL